jgi:hypothetical protein
VLKLIVIFGTLLIGVEDAGLQREERVEGRPQRRECTEELLDRPRFGESLKKKSTGRYNRAFVLRDIQSGGLFTVSFLNYSIIFLSILSMYG